MNIYSCNKCRYHTSSTMSDLNRPCFCSEDRCHSQLGEWCIELRDQDSNLDCRFWRPKYCQLYYPRIFQVFNKELNLAWSRPPLYVSHSLPRIVYPAYQLSTYAKTVSFANCTLFFSGKTSAINLNPAFQRIFQFIIETKVDLQCSTILNVTPYLGLRNPLILKA